MNRRRTCRHLAVLLCLSSIVAFAQTTAPSKTALFEELKAADLPNLTYSAESLTRFKAALLKLPPDKLKHLHDAITEFRDANPNAPELSTLLPIRWRLRNILNDTDEYRVRWVEINRQTVSPSPVIQQAAKLERAHFSITEVEDILRAGQIPENDNSAHVINELVTDFPGNATAAHLIRRRLEANRPGPDYDDLEQTLLTHFPETPAARQHAAQKLLSEDAAPLQLPFEISPAAKDNPLLLHFCSPAAPTTAAHLQALKILATKNPDAVTILLIPVGPQTTADALKTYCAENAIPFPQAPFHTAADFAKAQGITEAELPLTYLLTPETDGPRHLAAIRYDTRLEKPLNRLLAPR